MGSSSSSDIDRENKMKILSFEEWCEANNIKLLHAQKEAAMAFFNKYYLQQPRRAGRAFLIKVLSDYDVYLKSVM